MGHFRTITANLFELGDGSGHHSGQSVCKSVRIMPYLRIIAAVFLWIASAVAAANAASSPVYENEYITARLITAERGVTPDAGALSAALHIELRDGWKTYWKSPGQVGYPPEISWDGSQNLFSGQMLFPTPERFNAFDIENYGYSDTVTYPVQILLESRGAATDLKAGVSLLVCKEICVPQEFELTLSLFNDAGVDPQEAELIARALDSLPKDSDESGLSLDAVHLSRDDNALSAQITSLTPLSDPQIFPDLGLDAAFGPPEWDIAQDGLSAWVHLPVLALPESLPQLELVVANGAQAASFLPDWSATAPTPPGGGQTLWSVIVLALLGGLILNVMPCVLPVLSIKLTSALKARDQSLPRIRAGFVMSALGVLSFMWALAVILISIRAAGGQIGWGIQFQNPVFLGVMLSIVTLFAANMLGLFEITLPQRLHTRLAGIDGQPGLAGDFMTGALAAVLATPCSAPFLGTAVAFALAGSSFDVLVIFTALGLGLAVPYLLVALRPSLIRALPKPGRWMLVVKWIMGLLLALTALWLAWLLSSVAGWVVVAGVGVLLATALLAMLRVPMLSLAAIATAVILPVLITPPTPPAAAANSYWTAFDQTAIPGHVATGQVVFVDVTADWCLTCKTNKALVLDQDVVQAALIQDDVMPMQADWTKPNAAILNYLQSYGRFGIPFNIVYGPGAPQGIPLPEILTRDAVLDALAKARG